MIPLTETIAFNTGEIKERFVRATGAGSQNPNREATAVELRVDLRVSALPPELVARLAALAGKHITRRGVLMVVSRAHRSLPANRDAARARLVALLTRAATPPKKRKATKPLPEARRERLAEKHRKSAVKASRSGRDEA